MRNLMVVPAGAVAVCLGTMLVYGGLPPRGQPLPNAEVMEQYLFKGLFPDKPDNMSFVQYCRQYTELDSNLSQVLERLEFNVLDAENLENVIKLSEDLMRLREERRPPALRGSPAGPADARRHPAPRGSPAGPVDARRLATVDLAGMATPLFKHIAWDFRQRNKLVEFMQYAVYSAKYEINKMNELRRRWAKDMVFKMGLIHGRQLELKTSAALLFSTLTKVYFEVSMIWFVFQYHKLLNMAYDVTSNAEQMFLINEVLKSAVKFDGFDQVQTPPPHSG